jgi:hypothetical protein
MPWIGFVFLMVHLSINHIARQAANTPAVVDVTGKSSDTSRMSGRAPLTSAQVRRWSW